MTSDLRGPYVWGNTRATMGGSQWVAKSRDGANPTKTVLSSDWRLQLASMKLESLVTANQLVAVNTFSALVHTARHTTKARGIRSLYL